MESDLHLGQIAVRMGLIRAQELPRLIQEARAGHVEESAGSGSAFAQMLLRKRILSVSDYLYMADQARTERSDADAGAPLRQLEDAFRSYESGELDASSFEEIVHSTSGEPIRRPREQLQRFGRYELLEEVARGGMGIVYRSRDTNNGVVLALKVMIEADDDEVRLARFEREAELCGSLDHPNIVRIHDAGRVEGMPYFTMDLVEGESLDDMLEGDGIPRDLALRGIAQTARAMHHAHERGIIHRDLKPGNILIERKTGNAKVTDFGLARDLYRGTRLTQVGQAVGTPYYMAPEQVRGERDVDGRCDIYALGVILYEILTGDIPFDADSPLSLFRKIDREEIVLELDEELGIDRRIHAIAMRALAKDRDQRYHHADLFADDLERYLRGETPRAQPYDWREALRRKVLGPGRGVALGALVAVTLLVLGLALALGVRRLRATQARNDAREKVQVALDTAQAARDKAQLASDPSAVAKLTREGLHALEALAPLREAEGPAGEGARSGFADAEGPALELELATLRARSVLSLARGGKEPLDEARRAVQTLLERDPREATLRLELARVLSEHGRLEEAQAICDRLVDLDASQREVRLERARLLMLRARFAAAERDLSAVLLHSKRDVDALVARSAARLAQGELDEAASDARNARDLAPGRLEGHLATGDVARARGRREDALASYGAARDLAAKDPRPALRTGELHLRLGSWEAALSAFELAGRLGAEVEGLRGEAQARAHLFQLEGANEAIARALTACEGLAPARRARLRAQLRQELGVIQLAADRPEDAALSFQAALEEDPSAWQARLWLGRLALVREDLAAARRQLDPLARGREPEVEAALSELAALQDDDRRARELAEQAVATIRGARPSPRARRALARALLGQAAEDVARRSCRAAWEDELSSSDLSGALLRRGREWVALRAVYGRDSVTQRSEELLRAVLRLNPHCAQAHGLLAQLTAAEQQHLPAWRALERAWDLDPYQAELAETACELALAERGAREGRLEQALEAVERVNRSAPSGDRLLLQARCLAGLERWAQAAEVLERAGRLLPTRPEVETLRATICRARGQTTGAELAEQAARRLGSERQRQRLDLRRQAEQVAESDPPKAIELLSVALRQADPLRDRDHPELARRKAALLRDPLEQLLVVAPSLLQRSWELLDQADRVLASSWQEPLTPAARARLRERVRGDDRGALLVVCLAAFYDALTGSAAPDWSREGLKAAIRLVELDPACLPAQLARGALRTRVGDPARALRELRYLRHAYGSSALYQFAVAEAAAALAQAELRDASLEKAAARDLPALGLRKRRSAFLR